MDDIYEQTYKQTLVELETNLERYLEYAMTLDIKNKIEAYSQAIQRLNTSGAPNTALTLSLLKTLQSVSFDSEKLNTLSAAYQRIRTSNTQ